MKIAIFTDIHDQLENLNWAMDAIKKETISHIFALGDYTSSCIVKRLQASNTPVSAIWGNGDGDALRSIIRATNDENPNISFAKYSFDTIDIGDKKYFITHYPELAENAAKSLDYDAVFHGHTHHMKAEKIGDIPMICPGKLAMHPNDKISFAIFDTINSKTQFIIKPN